MKIALFYFNLSFDVENIYSFVVSRLLAIPSSNTVCSRDHVFMWDQCASTDLRERVRILDIDSSLQPIITIIEVIMITLMTTKVRIKVMVIVDELSSIWLLLLKKITYHPRPHSRLWFTPSNNSTQTDIRKTTNLRKEIRFERSAMNREFCIRYCDWRRGQSGSDRWWTGPWYRPVIWILWQTIRKLNGPLWDNRCLWERSRWRTCWETVGKVCKRSLVWIDDQLWFHWD